MARKEAGPPVIPPSGICTPRREGNRIVTPRATPAATDSTPLSPARSDVFSDVENDQTVDEQSNPEVSKELPSSVQSSQTISADVHATFEMGDSSTTDSGTVLSTASRSAYRSRKGPKSKTTLLDSSRSDPTPYRSDPIQPSRSDTTPPTPYRSDTAYRSDTPSRSDPTPYRSDTPIQIRHRPTP